MPQFGILYQPFERFLMAHIHWTLKEQTLLAEACAGLLKSQVAKTNLQALRIAEELLPEDRRRNITTMSLVPWLQDSLALRKSREQAASEKIEVANNRNITEIPVDELVQRIIAGITPHLEKIVTEKLSSAKIQSAMDSAMNSYLKELTGGMNAIGKKAAVEASRHERKKIVLVNLLASQYEEVKSEYHELFDLILWCDKDDSYTSLRTHASNAYRIFGMTDFMRHSVDKFLATHAKERYVRFTGGVSTLKKLIEYEYCEL
jgi:hypothetical protein